MFKIARPERLSAVLALALVSLTMTIPSQAGPAKVGETAGKTYGEWSAAWWQWLLEIPAADSPQTAEGEIDCSVNQSGAVWFLAGAPLGSSVERSCTVVGSKPLFFPLLNILFTNDPDEFFTIEEKRQQLDGALNDTEPGPLADFGLPGSRACGLFVTLDGEPVVFSAPSARVQSPPFAVDSAEGRAGLDPGLVDPVAITDGFWMMLPRLTPGEHTLRFGGRVCEFDTIEDHPVLPPVEVSYRLTVTGDDDDSDSDSDSDSDEPGNVEIIDSLYTAFGVGDLDTILAIIDEDVIWIESEGIPYGGTFIGRDAVFAGVFGKIADEWDGFTATVDEVFAANGNRVIVRQRDGGTFKATGKSMEAPAISIWTLDAAGRVVRFEQVIDTQEVVSATIP